MNDRVMTISRVGSFGDTNPVQWTLTWGEFLSSCRYPTIRGHLPLDQYLVAEKSVRNGQKDGPAIIAGRYRKSGTRLQADLESLSMVTLDFDDGYYSFESLCVAMGGFEAVIFTSYSNSVEASKLRAYLLLTCEIVGDIKATLEAIIEYFEEKVGHVDPACRKPGQLFYTPACPPGGEGLYRVSHITGSTVDPADFVVPAKGVRAVVNGAVPPLRSPASTRPGDIYNAQASWADLLEPLGWRIFFGSHWTRPGKERGVSATILGGGLYIHSSAPETAPFKCGRCYSPFGAYALIHHGGDHSVAAKALRALDTV